ncbi:hypothetical protein [Tabrizicola sp.]|uniref:hypothetical protein n=1 Tax=Tabrizicola sp. TaxID=2005166 RepID=UPI003F3145C3
MRAPRLHVLTALASEHAVVLRRGPSAWSASFGWNRATGAMSPGQWLRGRIYEHRCDLSPDGGHLIYFAGKGGSSYYTALSRAPWLKALRLWEKGDTWGGGGAFAPDGGLWLNGHALHKKEWLPKGMGVALGDAFPGSIDGFFGGNTVAARLALRGWVVEGTGYAVMLKRPLWHGWQLVRWFENMPRRAVASSCHALERAATGEMVDLPGWEWAEPWEGRLQFAAGGKLQSVALEQDGSLSDLNEIRDFNGLTPDPQEAPAAAHDRKAPNR